MSQDTNPSPALESAADASGTLAPWRRYLSLLGCWILGVVFLIASWAKSVHPSAFADQITSEGLAIVLSASAIALIALFIEWFIAVALLLGVRHRWVVLPTAGLVTFFLFLTGRTYWRSLQGIEPEGSSCGCFGNLVSRSPAEAFWQDLLLMVPALLLIMLALGRGALPRWRILIAGLVATLMTLFAWRAPELPLDDFATRLKPGTDPFEWCAGAASSSQVCMDAIIPELWEGEHVVILADLDNTDFQASVEDLNERYLDPELPKLWVLTSATEEELFEFRFSYGPIFEIREAPQPLLKPLYRRLPRSFAVSGGEVSATYDGLPPSIPATP